MNLVTARAVPAFPFAHGWRHALLIPLLGLSACTGMYVGAPGNHPAESEAPGADMAARADIHTMTPATVAQLDAEMAARRAQAAAQRVAQSPPPAKLTRTTHTA